MDITQNIAIILQALVILVSFLSVVYTLGIVLRVEKKLDVAYKLFLAAILFFIASEILDVISIGFGPFLPFAANSFKLVFATLFLVGILEMRSLIRKLDGEK